MFTTNAQGVTRGPVLTIRQQDRAKQDTGQPKRVGHLPKPKTLTFGSRGGCNLAWPQHILQLCSFLLHIQTSHDGLVVAGGR